MDRKVISFLVSFMILAPTFFLLVSPVKASSCGRLSSYTTIYDAGYPKPILFVWKGKDKPNPTEVIVMYKNQVVPSDDAAIKTGSGPQVDKNDGWVGYFIAKRWYATHWDWDDDSNWFVSGCIK